MDDAIDFYRGLPVLTRSWLTLSVGLTAAASLELIDRQMLVFDWDRVSNHLELWRILTSFCYGGGHFQQFHVLILIYLILTMGRSYESKPLNAGAGGTRADAAFAALFCAVTILLTVPLINTYGPLLLQYLGYRKSVYRRFRMEAVFTRTLVYAILYLWSRRNPNARADLNMVPMQARYIPFAHIALGWFMNHRIHETIHGIVVGHIFYYWTIVVPTVTQGRLALRTPQLLIDFCNDNPQVLEVVDEEEEEDNDDGRLIPQEHLHQD